AWRRNSRAGRSSRWRRAPRSTCNRTPKVGRGYPGPPPEGAVERARLRETNTEGGFLDTKGRVAQTLQGCSLTGLIEYGTEGRTLALAPALQGSGRNRESSRDLVYPARSFPQQRKHALAHTVGEVSPVVLACQQGLRLRAE